MTGWGGKLPDAFLALSHINYLLLTQGKDEAGGNMAESVLSVR